MAWTIEYAETAKKQLDELGKIEGVDRFDVCEASEVLCVEGQNAFYPVDVHRRNESCVMHLDSGDAEVNKQFAPFRMNGEAIREQPQGGFKFCRAH